MARYINRSTKNIYWLLINLISGDENILSDSLRRKIEAANHDKENIDASIEKVSADLELANQHKGIIENGPGAFLTFVEEYNSNKLIIDYLSILGYENILKDCIASNESECATGYLKGKIDDEIASLSDKIERLEVDSSLLEERLERYYKIRDNLRNTVTDLKYLIEAAVSGNGSFNKDYVVGLLTPLIDVARNLGIIFPENFLLEASKAIFFPEGGLAKVVSEYGKGVSKDILFDGTSQVSDMNDGEDTEDISSVPINSVEETLIPEEEFTVEGIEEDDAVESHDVDTDDLEIKSEKELKINPNDDVVDVSIEAIGEEDDVSNVASPIIEKMSEEIAGSGDRKDIVGLNSAEISESLQILLRKNDEGLIERNIETLKALNVPESVLYYVSGEYSYLTDKDLANLLNYLRGKGLSEKTISDAVELHYVDCGLKTIKEGVNTLENSNYGFDKRYIAIFKYGVLNFLNSLDELRKNGIEPDESEIAAFLTILASHSYNVGPDTEILKDYGISLLRKNGKYELGLYLKSPSELVKAIDYIIESNEEALLGTPEVLAMDTYTVMKRIEFCKKNNIEYKEGDVYADFIYKPGLFNRKFNNPMLDIDKSLEESNGELEKMLNNDYCSILIEVLDDCYKDEMVYKPVVDLSEDEKGIFNELIGLFESKYGAKLINKNSYEIDGVLVSRNKIERNLSCLVGTLVPDGEDLLSVAWEVLMVSAFYNSRRHEEKIIKMPQYSQDEYSGIGGMAA